MQNRYFYPTRNEQLLCDKIEVAESQSAFVMHASEPSQVSVNLSQGRRSRDQLVL